MTSQFVHLNVHTEFSIIDGMVRLDPLMDAVVDRGMNAVAVTDFCNLFAVVKLFKAAISKGIKPIIGSEVNVEGAEFNYRLILLAKNI